MLQILPCSTNGAVKIANFDNLGPSKVSSSDLGVDFDLGVGRDQVRRNIISPDNRNAGAHNGVVLHIGLLLSVALS